MKWDTLISDDDCNDVLNYTCNGQCSNCGKCCSDILPISKNEIDKIKKYIKSHKIKEQKNVSILDTRINLTCPFRDEINKKCLIYEVRPEICKCFICSQPKPDMVKAKRLMHEKKDVESMRNVFYGGKPIKNLLFDAIIKMKEGDYDDFI